MLTAYVKFGYFLMNRSNYIENCWGVLYSYGQPNLICQEFIVRPQFLGLTFCCSYINL